MDPLFAWIVAAQRQRADDMHFKPCMKKTPSGIPLYGGGVQQGLAFKEACRSCPAGTHPMCFSLHWDGTSAHGVSAAPICVGVANTNNAGPNAQFCLGYMPDIPRQGKSFYATQTATNVKFHIRQQVVAAILRVLETAAITGVLCPFKNCHGRDVSLLLMPRLLTAPIDQPEAQLFYGMKNRWSCSKCKRREGYSAFRKSSLQHGATVKCLYHLARDPTSPWQRKAQTRLQRYGFNPSRFCILTSVCDKVLVRIPYPNQSVEVFPCVDYRDKMHGIFIFFHKCIMAALNQIAWKPVRLGLSAKQLLDQRLTLIGYSRAFRCVDTGRSHRVQKSIFSDANMSATDKWILLFLLPHVLGHQGVILPENVRIPMLTAIAHAQLIILACRGRREYTKSELSQIYDNGYVQVFQSLEHINRVSHDSKYDSAYEKHAHNPDSNPPPKRFKSMRYYSIHLCHVTSHPNLLPNPTSNRRERDSVRCGSDTDDTHPEFAVGGLGKFSHGVYNLVHQHWVSMLEALGGFNVADTEGPEAYHKTCMRLASQRVRHLETQYCTTHDSMRRYLLRHVLFTTLHAMVHPPVVGTNMPRKTGVQKPLRHLIGGNIRPVFMGQNLASVAMQSQILHEEVRITRVELMDLLCGVFSIHAGPASYTLLESLQWTFGHKLVTQDHTFWATDSQYTTNAQKFGSRRDNFVMHGTVPTEVNLAAGTKETRSTALCCQSICFISLGNMNKLQQLNIPRDIRKEIIDDTLTLALIRWFEPDPAAIERDSRSLPLCPPPFSINHALWRFAKTQRARQCLLNADGAPSPIFARQRHMFGKSRSQQLERLREESHAYYGLVLPSNIHSVAYMYPEFEPNSFQTSSTWLQTINFT